MLAEVVHHFIPRLVELHNYSAAHSVRQKMYNWQTLNRALPLRAFCWLTASTACVHDMCIVLLCITEKALKRLGCQLSPETIDALVNAKPGVIENVLVVLQQKVCQFCIMLVFVCADLLCGLSSAINRCVALVTFALPLGGSCHRQLGFFAGVV